jgi:L,D-peptidoglycan transpeptidase YkuD (ErfK/YbiS/YcfS/YnhG family)
MGCAVSITVEAKAGETVGVLRFEDLEFRCALGRSGITEGKREGDGGTPTGRYQLRSLFYRPDRSLPPPGRLHPIPLQRDYGWGDDSHHPESYNRLILLPVETGHEVLWREDEIYDLIVVIGYNDAPPIAGRGSAIFLHLAREGLTPTEGCVALARPDLLALLARIGPETPMEIREI